MQTITYKEYVKYIRSEFSKMDTSTLSEQDRAYYEIVKNDLDGALTMPSYILDAPLLNPRKSYDQDTLLIANRIANTISIRGRLKAYGIKIISSLNETLRSSIWQKVFQPLVFATIIIGLVLLITSILPYPNLSSVNPETLAGAGGGASGSGTSDAEGLSLTWLVVPLILLLIIGFVSEKKK